MAKLDTEFVPAATLDYLSKITTDSTSSVVSSLINKFKNEIEAGIKEGKSSKQIASTLQSNFTDIKSKASANAVARTALHGAYNHGVLADTMDDPAIIAYRFVAIVDSRTTDICEALSNKIIPKDEVLNYLPPLHFNCRSTLQPVYIIEKIDNKDLITNFKKTKEYKDKVEPSYNKKFNAYHNEDLKTEFKDTSEYLKPSKEVSADFIQSYEKSLNETLNKVKTQLDKNKDLTKIVTDNIALTANHKISDLDIKTKNDLMIKVKPYIKDINTRTVLSEASTNKFDNALKLSPKDLLKNINKGIDDLIVEKQLNDLTENSRSIIPTDILNDIQKQITKKDKIKLDKDMKDYLKANLKSDIYYDKEFFNKYMKLQKDKNELDKIVNNNISTYMLDNEIINKLNKYYSDAAELIKNITKTKIDKTPDLFTDIKIKLTTSQTNEINKIMIDKYINETITALKNQYKLNTEQVNILQNTFQGINNIDYSNPIKAFQEYIKLVSDKAKSIKNDLQSPYKQFENLFKTKPELISLMLNSYLQGKEKPDYKKEVESLIKKSNETLNKKIADNKEKIKNLKTADELLEFLNTSIIPDLPLQNFTNSKYKIELVDNGMQGAAFVFDNNSNIYLVDNTHHNGKDYLKKLLDIIKDDKTKLSDDDTGVLSVLYHEYLHKQENTVLGDGSYDKDINVKFLVEGINDLKAVMTINRFAKLFGLNINNEINVTKSMIYGYRKGRSYIQNVALLFGINLEERIDELHNIINDGCTKDIENKLVEYISKFSTIDKKDVNLILQRIDRTGKTFSVIADSDVIKDIQAKYKYKTIKEFIKKDVEKPKIIYNDAGDNQRLIQDFMRDNKINMYNIKNDSMYIIDNAILISTDNTFDYAINQTKYSEKYKEYNVIVNISDKENLLNKAKRIIDKFEILKSNLKQQKDTALKLVITKSNKESMVDAIKDNDLLYIKELLQQGIKGSEYLKLALDLGRTDIYDYLIKYMIK